MTARPRALIGWASVVLLTACSAGSASGGVATPGAPSGPAPSTVSAPVSGSSAGSSLGTSGPASGPAAPAADPHTVVLTAEGVAGLATGSPGPAVEAVLRERLGAPGKVTEVGPSCTGIHPQPPTRGLGWGGLSVILSREKKGLVLLGWSVVPGPLPAAVRLPHGVTAGTTVHDALLAIPGATGNWDDTFRLYAITAPGDAGMVWAGTRADAGGPVTMITNSVVRCD